VLQSRTSRWSVGTALLCVALLAFAWFLLISPRRAQAADLGFQQQSAEQQNDVLRAKLDQLRAEFAQLPAARAQLTQIHQQLPPTADVPTLVRTLSSLATSAGVTLVSITPGSAQALAADGSVTAGASTGTPALAVLPVVTVVTGDYFQAVAYVRALQVDMPRAFLINALSIAKSQTGTADSVQLTLTGKVFSMPAATGDGAASTPAAGPAPASAQAVS
jgi:Tfp pilus assembly protein PilO